MVVRSYFYLAIGFNVQQQVSLLPLSNTPNNDGCQLSPTRSKPVQLLFDTHHNADFFFQIQL